MNRRGDKVVEIEEYVESLKNFLPESFDEYLSDEKSRLACERCFEKIVESVIDLVILVIKERGLGVPMSDRDAFNILSENDIISSVLSEKLGDAKSMRNIIIHKYGHVDDKKVFDAIKNELLGDVKELLEAVR